MKEYVIIEVRCKKNLTIADMYGFIKGKIKHNNNFFELLDLFKFSKKPNTNALQKLTKLSLDEYEYTKVLEHLSQNPNYDPKRDDRKVISNLDKRWQWYNYNNSQSLTDEQFSELIDFCDALKPLDVSTLMIGIDEIEWDNQKSNKGTFGYEKAHSTYSLGKNYLSNSITIGRSSGDKYFTAYISYEKHLITVDAINRINMITEFLGETIDKKSYFAPENELERNEWDGIYEEAKLKFDSAISGVKALGFATEIKPASSEESKFNIKKYIKKYLCTDGWSMGKKNPSEIGTKVNIEKNGDNISLYIVSNHYGQHLQLLLYYENTKFSFGKNLCYSFYSSSEDDLVAYFENVKTIRDYLYSIF